MSDNKDTNKGTKKDLKKFSDTVFYGRWKCKCKDTADKYHSAMEMHCSLCDTYLHMLPHSRVHLDEAIEQGFFPVERAEEYVIACALTGIIPKLKAIQELYNDMNNK